MLLAAAQVAVSDLDCCGPRMRKCAGILFFGFGFGLVLVLSCDAGVVC
jgi:hypothetical protein